MNYFPWGQEQHGAGRCRLWSPEPLHKISRWFFFQDCLLCLKDWVRFLRTSFGFLEICLRFPEDWLWFIPRRFWARVEIHPLHLVLGLNWAPPGGIKKNWLRFSCRLTKALKTRIFLPSFSNSSKWNVRYSDWQIDSPHLPSNFVNQNLLRRLFCRCLVLDNGIIVIALLLPALAPCWLVFIFPNTWQPRSHGSDPSWQPGAERQTRHEREPQGNHLHLFFIAFIRAPLLGLRCKSVWQTPCFIWESGEVRSWERAGVYSTVTLRWLRKAAGDRGSQTLTSPTPPSCFVDFKYS